MPTKDFRVRLSAEGQQEVIKAFRAVQAEADKTRQRAHEASHGFDELKESARSLAVEFLGYEAALRVFEGIKGAVERSLEFAASMGKLQEKTGLSATTLQVWTAQAKRAGIEQETVSKGLGLFAKAMGNLEQGSTKSSVSLRILLGSATALKGLTTDEKLHKITDALSKMDAGGQKAKITTDLFGKSGLALIPVLDKLGGDGFDKLKDKLQAFGALLTDEAIQEAKIAEESLGDLKLAAQGLAMQFTEGLLPAITNIAGALVSFDTDAEGGGSAVKDLGTKVGELTKQMAFGAAYAAIYGRSILDTGVSLVKTAATLAASMHPFRDFHKIMQEGHADLVQADNDRKATTNILLKMIEAGDKAQEQARKEAEEAVEAAKKARLKTEADVANAAEVAAAERLAKAKTGLEIAQAQDALQRTKETNRQAAEFEKERWDAGVESIDRYYSVRRDLAKKLADEEQAALAKQIAAQQAALKREVDPAKRVDIQKAILDLETKADLQRMQSENEIEKMILEEIADREKLASGALSYEDKLLEAQGKRHEIELASIRREAEEYRKKLTQSGDPNANAKVEEFKKTLTAQADYAEANRQLDQSEKKMAEERRRIDDLAEQGVINQREKKNELISLDQKWQPVLEKQLATLREIAKASGLAPLIDDSDEAKSKVDDLHASLTKVKTGTDQLGKQFGKSIGHDLHNFMVEGIRDSDDLGRSFERLGLSVAQSFVSMLAKMMRQKSDGGGGKGGNDAGLFSFLKAFAPQENDAGGEITHGPSGTDRVPSWLTRGEFVVRQPIVAQPGMRQLLNAINQGTSTPSLVKSPGPRFNMGGEVSGGTVLGGGKRSGDAALTVGLDFGLVIKKLEAHPDFGRVVVRHLGDNRNAANAALGR